ncbi:choice-of-anchor I family protein [uncultured Roseibium sp.]|uniref:choice-of-anchor I family protein n=2 Tax=uncultured Roseibium sp. TaxID=1936171 RepID=UPI0026031270|nr:choice-of-anchor I family protein [uncultured Roseibium sp.]
MGFHFRSKFSRDFFSRSQEISERQNKAMEEAQQSLSANLDGYHAAKFGLGGNQNPSIFDGIFDDFGFGNGFKFGRFIFGTQGDDTLKGDKKGNFIFGLNGDDDIFGRRGNDKIFGNRGDDRIKGGKGNDFADGGQGIDTLVFSGKLKHYEIDLDTGIVKDLRKGNKDGTDTFVNIEFLEFKDQTISLIEPEVFTLELLHFADQEANAATIDNIDNLSGVLNALRAEDIGDDGVDDNTLTLSSGDAIIPGLFFDASEAVFGSQGIADIQIQNELGVQAIALGNHEFDLGTGLLAGLISGDATGGFTGSEFVGTDLEGADFAGALFPYLSTNLDFSTDPNLAPLETAGGQDTASLQNVVTSSSISDVNGEKIAIIGATVPTIRSISSPGDDLGISPAWASGSPTDAELDALAAIIQAEVDQLLSDNPDLNKVILLSHMQQISIEQSLTARLENIDIIVAGGSNTRLFDDNDRIRDGDSDQGEYPQFITNAGGTTTAVVNTDGNYKYVGRLVIDFDADGNIIADSYDEDVSGAYATDDQGVADLNAEGLIDPEIDAITDAIQAQIVATESNVFGVSDVFLNGNRSGTFTPDDPDGVRTQETNLGNLTADANLAYANEIIAAEGLGDEVVISIKNGGGIRANIGQIVVPAGGTEAVRVPNEEIVDGDGNVVKPEGGISQNDIATTLAFNNGLTLLDISKEEIKAFLEGAVSALPDGVSGGFPQISGLKFSFDETQTAQTYDQDGNIATPGERVINAGIFDEDGNLISAIVRDGQIVGDSAESFRIVTLNFLANAGDEILSTLSNPNRVDLIDLDSDGVDDDAFTGDATFAADGSEQDALAEYLDDNFNPENGGTAYDEADTGPVDDERIQNLTFREDTVFEGIVFDDDDELEATIVADFEGDSGDPDDPEGASEVVAHEDGLLYVTNGANDRIDIFDIAGNTLANTIPLGGLDGYDGVQSVAVKNGLVAAAISRAPVEETNFGVTKLVEQPGFVAVFDASTLALITTVDVGNLPDMLTFNNDGTMLLVAGEGQFNEDSIDDGVAANPLGTVALIDVSDFSAHILDFTQFNGFEDAARAAGIRIQEGVDFADDVEPEYIAVSPDGTTAFVSLQENNAFAKIDLATKTIVDVFDLGVTDYSQIALDPLDDGNINIQTFDNLVGFRMPDAIATAEIGGQTYVLTANEGDNRDFDEDRVFDLAQDGLIDPTVQQQLIDAGQLDLSNEDFGLGRLEVSTLDGDTDGDGDIDVLHTFSSRSFSIFDDEGNLVFDSGSEFEEKIAEIAPERFNSDDGDDSENRSDAKGPEPEAIITGVVDGSVYAFIGLERDSGIMIYNIDDPANASFVDYIPPLHVDNAAPSDVARHGPETIAFIPAEESTTGNAQIAVAYEISGTTIVYDITSSGETEQPLVINEVLGSTTGPDSEYIELFGTPGESLAGLSLIVVESDDQSSNGTIDRQFDFGDDAVIGENGFYLVANELTESTYSVTADDTIPDNFIENSSYTIALVETASITGSTVTGLEVVIDTVGVTDGEDDSFFAFDAPVIGPDGSFLPAGVGRITDGVDTDTAADWSILDFNNSPDVNTPTPGHDDGNGGGGSDEVAIYEIQGAGHTSAFEGQTVLTSGVVTAVDTNGFYLQDPDGDDDIATSNGIFVFTGNAPAVSVGDAVDVEASVSEFTPGGVSSRNLSITQLVSPVVTVTGTGAAVAATVIGQGGRLPPSEVIDDDAFGTIAGNGGFDPETDGIDFFESLEGMLVTAQDVVAVAGTNRFGEIFGVVDQGADATGISDRGTLNISPDDFNPEKVQIDFDSGILDFDFPDVNVGDQLGDVTGVVSYSFGNFEIAPTVDFTSQIVSAGLEEETTEVTGAEDLLTIASYNVLNLDTNDADGDADVANGRFTKIAEHIVNNLGTPDIIGLQEVQDNSGSTDDGVVSASETLQLLVDEIDRVDDGLVNGSLNFAFVDNTFITDNASGGQPGGNIRTAFLYNVDRVDLVEGSVEAVGDQSEGSPFEGARLPLAATFDFSGDQVTIVNNHLSSKGGSAPILGVEQPFDQRQEDVTVNGSLDERQAQAAAVSQYVDDIYAVGGDFANVVVLGDMNEFEFISPLETLADSGAGLVNLSNTVDEDEIYSFIFQGNSQALDHILVSEHLADNASFDFVHVNSEFAETDERASDHDPLVAQLDLSGAGDAVV